MLGLKNKVTKLRKADKEMTNALAPYRSKINNLNNELNNQHEFLRNNNMYSLYRTEAAREKQYNRVGELENEISKTQKKMEKERQRIKKARANGKALLRTTIA